MLFLVLDLLKIATFGVMVPVATTVVSVACVVVTTTVSFVATRVYSRLSGPSPVSPSATAYSDESH